ncbi:MAG TPA: hypothetical protein P5168_03695 [Candidatus Methanomethylicus sp.]|nr:hypothetical protein [Candidatus Methanomethylicus sp.]HRU81634.1 hypothetical protein [Candidatus Methanomethylicus sp.]
MVKVAFRYNQELVQWIKSSGSGAKWNRDEKVWEFPDELLDGLMAKAAELNIEVKTGAGAPQARADQQPPPLRESYQSKQDDRLGYVEWDEPQRQQRTRFQEDADRQQAPTQDQRSGPLKEGEIRLRRSRDGRFVLMSMNLIAFTTDVEDLINGKKDSVKFRLLPPRPPPQQQNTR